MSNKIQETFYRITFNDSTDDGFGGSQHFINSVAISNANPLFNIYMESSDIVDFEEITQEEYEEEKED